jgi:hypothetical protein
MRSAQRLKSGQRLYPKRDLSEVALREGVTGTGFEIALERHSSFLVGELNDNVDMPWAPSRRVHASAVVVSRESREHIRSDAGVVASGVTFALQDVDESLGPEHDTRTLQCEVRNELLTIDELSVRRLKVLRTVSTPEVEKSANLRRWLANRPPSCGLPTVARSRRAGPPSRCALRWTSRRYGGRPSRDSWLATRSSLACQAHLRTARFGGQPSPQSACQP